MLNIVKQIIEIISLNCCISAMDYIMHDKPTKKEVTDKFPSFAEEVITRLKSERAINFATKKCTTIVTSKFNAIRGEYVRKRKEAFVNLSASIFKLLITGTTICFFVYISININIIINYLQKL